MMTAVVTAVPAVGTTVAVAVLVGDVVDGVVVVVQSGDKIVHDGVVVGNWVTGVVGKPPLRPLRPLPVGVAVGVAVGLAFGACGI